jgi:trimeric autotransporter adhesin
VRLLQVPTGSGEVIDLHPAVSVVTGLTAEQRQVLIDVVAGLPAGQARGSGLIEAHDVLFDLDADVLDLFELGDQQVDPVVGPAAHRGPGADGGAAPGGAPPEPTSDGSSTGSEAIDAARAEVEQARSAHAAAAAALDAATSARDEAAATVSACTAAPGDTEGPDGDVSDDGDDGVGDEAAPGGPTAALEAARRRLVAAEAAALADRDAATAAEETAAAEELSGLRSRRDDLETRRTELTGLLTVLADDAADEVVALLGELDRDDDAPAEHDPRALALADEITALVASLDELPAAEPGAPSLDDARQRLDRARAALEGAEARQDLPPDDAGLAIEQAHEELLAALDEAERRFRRARARQRVEEARAAEQAALAALGLNSYTDFLTGGPRSTPADAVGGVDDATAELAAAEEAVTRAEEVSRAEQRRAEVREQLADALDRAAAVVGRPLRDEPLRVARALRTVVAEPPDRRDDLVGALSRAGVALTGAAGDGTDAASAADDPRSDADLELDLADLEVLARALVDEAETNALRRQRALTELADVESELAAVAERLAGSVATQSGQAVAGAPDDTSRAAVEDDDEVRSAREAVQAAEAAVAEQADARAAAQERLASAASAELAAAERHVAASDALDEAEAALAAAEARLIEAEAAGPVAPARPDRAPAELVASAPVGASDEQAAGEARDAGDGEDAGDGQDASGPASLEWFVLSRMAAQRAVSYVGGLPLVLDRTLDSLDAGAVSDVLGRLEPTASAVQLIVLTESEGAVRWAEAVGPDRAAVVRPGPATS